MHITLHLSTACNMRCDYCYAPPRPGTPMSLETGRQAMDLGSGMTEGSCGVIFFGGEPLLYPDLIRELVAYGRHRECEDGRQFHFKTTTNGLALDGAFLEFSLREDILIAISCDGIREAHDAHRRGPDGESTWDTVIERLDMLLAARPYSSVLMVVNPDTAQHLTDSVGFLLDRQARYLIVSLNYAADWTEDDLNTLKKQYKKLGKQYVNWTQQGRKFYLSPFEVKLSSHINKHCYRAERCELARRQISVGPDGTLYPCVQFTRAGRESEWAIGTAGQGIDEAARQRIHDLSEEEKALCRECSIKERCNHTCGCLNWQATGSINEVSPVLCRHEQMLLPIADKVGETLYKKRNSLFLHKHYNSAYPVLSLIEDTIAED